MKLAVSGKSISGSSASRVRRPNHRGCGQPAGTQPAQPAPVVPALDYTIQGDNLQVIRIRLKHGQELYAEAGKMVYKTANVQWETRMSGGSIGEKILGALRRTVMGESVFLARERHLRALDAAKLHLARAAEERQHWELFAEELRLAQEQLSAITGAFTSDDLLGEIFGRFCIGK